MRRRFFCETRAAESVRLSRYRMPDSVLLMPRFMLKSRGRMPAISRSFNFSSLLSRHADHMTTMKKLKVMAIEMM